MFILVYNIKQIGFNAIGVEGVKLIAEVLKENTNLVSLVISIIFINSRWQ